MHHICFIVYVLVAVFGFIGVSCADPVVYEAERALAVKDYSRANELLLSAANSGNAKAQTSLAIMYEYGEGVPKSMEEAVKWYRKAAEHGEPVAQITLGLMYFSGAHLPLDRDQAIYWSRKSAEQGHVLAQHNLGYIYASEAGDSVPNLVEAYAWWSIAEAQGIWNARFRLNDITKKMSPAQVLEAEIRAADYLVRYVSR